MLNWNTPETAWFRPCLARHWFGFDAETGPEGGPIASNAAVLFDRSGKVAGIYRKAHPVAVAGTDELERGVMPGVETPMFDCDFSNLDIHILCNAHVYAKVSRSRRPYQNSK